MGCDADRGNPELPVRRHDETLGNHLRVKSCIPDALMPGAFTPPIPIQSGRPVHRRVEVGCERQLIAYRVEGVDTDWQRSPEPIDAGILSDECPAAGQPNFTCAFAGMAREGLSGSAGTAYFRWFEYVERDYQAEPFAVR